MAPAGILVALVALLYAVMSFATFLAYRRVLNLLAAAGLVYALRLAP